MKKAGLVLLTCVALVACSRSDSPAGPADSAAILADSVFTNGRIYTVNEDQPWVEAVAIKDGKFIVVGSTADVYGVTGDATAVTDLGGKFVMPGMIDVHTHGVDAHIPTTIQISDSDDLELILSEVRSYIETHPDQEVYWFDNFGFGLFPGDNGPKELLDEIASDKAIVIGHQSGHAFWVNSKALDMAGITAETPDPPQGIVVRKENGEPAGGLHEEAMRPIRAILPPASDEALMQSAQTAMSIFAAHGITATREAGTYPPRFAVMQQLEAQGRLKTRFSFASHWQTTLIDIPPKNDEVEIWLRQNAGLGSDMLKLDALKVYMDGVPASKTAAVKKAYLNEPDNFGQILITQEELDAALVKYDTYGVPVIMHVLGDLAMRMGIDAIAAAREANGDSGVRHHLSHSIIIDPADIDDIAEVGAVVDLSPFFPYMGPVHANHIEAFGEPFVQQWYRTRSLMDRGIPLALSTDYPVDQINPLVHIESAHTRKHPLGETTEPLGAHEAISREDAIKAYTLNPAYILGWEDNIGSIETGKYADMVVLDTNVFEVEAADISEIKVLQTLLNGEVIYDASASVAAQMDVEQMRLLAFSNLAAKGNECALHDSKQIIALKEYGQ